ncbi:MAG: protein kinase [Verrucomicrobiaceae bacterium]|nr:protein kinase [Verrucomicrobiaceae bacterium]
MPDPFAQQTIPSAAPRYHQGRKMFSGRYTLLKPLGRGGMGEVWLANDNELGVQRALKFAPPEVAADARSVAMLKREAIAGTSLAHPNIVRIFDFAHDPVEMESAVVMEVVEGKSLAELQAKRIEESGNGFFEPEEIEKWLRDACAALEYAHGEGRVHRDLKPQNLMVETASGRLKIMDFGISRRIGDSFSQLTGKDSSGTLPYMSPQQVMGEPPHASDDIYGLGATLYDLLSGSPPFIGGALEMQVREKAPVPILTRRAEVNASSGKPVPNAWETLVMKCLAKRREERPASFDAIRQAVSAPAPKTSATPPDDAEARKRAALDEKRKEEERQLAAERKRAREAQEKRLRDEQAAAQASPPPQPASACVRADDIYAEYLDSGGGLSKLCDRYVPVSSRGAWQDRKREARNILRRLEPGNHGIQAASSSIAAIAFAQRHQLSSGMFLCCETRPDHVCCSWMDIEDGVYEELATWSIDSAGLSSERLAARVWASCQGMQAHTHRDPAAIQCCLLTHSCRNTLPQTQALASKLPGKTLLWEHDLPASLAGAKGGLNQSDTLLLSALPFALSLRLPDMSLIPALGRFVHIPATRALDLSWPGGFDMITAQVELVEETDQGIVPLKSQTLNKSVAVLQNGRVHTRATIDIDAHWQASLRLEAPEGAASAAKHDAIPKTPAQAAPPPKANPANTQAPSTPPDPGNMDGVATILTILLIAGSFIAALMLRPDWDNVAYWRNATIVLLLLQLCACGAEKDGDEISKRLLGPVVVTLIAAILFAITSWIWPRTAATDANEAAKRFSESKVFTAPEAPNSEPPSSPLPSGFYELKVSPQPEAMK